MLHRSTVSGVLAGLAPLAFVAVLVAPTPASAADKGTKKTCAAAYSSYKTAAEREKAGLYSEAHALYSQCVEDDTCPGLQPKCRAARDRVEGRMPTIVPVVIDENGPVTDVVVKLDGAPVCTHLDGRAVPVEVGAHELTFTTSKGVIATSKVMIIEGAKDREIDVYVGGARPPGQQPVEVVAKSDAAPAAAPAAPAPAKSSDPPADNADPAAKPAEAPAASANTGAVATHSVWTMPTSPAPYIIGGIGLLGVAAGTLFTVWGNQDNSALSQCTPSCPRSSVDHIRMLYTGADIAFGASVVALGVTTVLFAVSRKEVSASAVSVGVAPSPSGAMASVGGSF